MLWFLAMRGRCYSTCGEHGRVNSGHRNQTGRPGHSNQSLVKQQLKDQNAPISDRQHMYRVKNIVCPSLRKGSIAGLEKPRVILAPVQRRRKTSHLRPQRASPLPMMSSLLVSAPSYPVTVPVASETNRHVPEHECCTHTNVAPAT